MPLRRDTRFNGSYHSVLFPPQGSEDSSGTPGVTDEISPPCTSSFFECLETLAREQQNKILLLNTALHGYDLCIYNPRIRVSQYDDEDQEWYYPDTPDYEGRGLITGLHEHQVFSGYDEWTSPEVILYWPEPPLFTIEENAKIFVHIAERRLVFRVKFLRRIVGQYYQLQQMLQLIPFN